MKPKTLVLLAVAGGCGLVAMLMVQQAMSGAVKTPAKPKTAKVLVALESIESGMRLTDVNVGFKELPIASLPEDSVMTVEDYAERAAKVPLAPGDILRKSKLTEPGGWGKSINIPNGMRVISINVDDTHTNSGLLTPGDRVDVLVTYQSKSDKGRSVTKTKTLLEFVEVFATDAHTATKMQDGTDTNRAKNVSLLLFPEQVTFIRLAERKGSLSLSWRNRLDDEVVQTRDVDTDLFEELSGSLGGGMDDRPGYEMTYESQYDSFENERFSDEPAPTVETPKPLQEDTTPAEFLDQVEEPKPVAVAVVAPPKPTWKLQIYNGNTAISHDFEIKEEPKPVEVVQEETPALPPVSIVDSVRWFWPTGNAQTKTTSTSTEALTEEEAITN